MDDYEYTGEDVPVRMNDVIDSVLNVLDQYDEAIKNGQTPETDPFREQIVLPNGENKFFAVPEEIQRRAIKIWLTNKEKSNNTNDEDDEENIEGFQNNNSSFMKYLLAIVVIAVLIWLSMKYLK